MSASAGSVPDPTVAHGNPDQPAADAAGEGGYSATDLKRAAHALSVRAQAFEAAITLLTDSWAPRGSPEAIAEILLQAVDAGGCCLFEVSPDEGMLVPVLLVGETPRSGGVRVSPDSMPGGDGQAVADRHSPGLPGIGSGSGTGSLVVPAELAVHRRAAAR
jgi:hypothetical protein